MQEIEVQDSVTATNCPIAVYQMGKVGSETIIKSLKEFGYSNNSIYHVHVMSDKNLEKSLGHLKEKNLPLTLQLEQSKELKKYLNRSASPRLKVITPVREPIGQHFSAFFQNLDRFYPDFLNSDGSCQETRIKDHLTNTVMTGNLPAMQWLDDEFRCALDIDIYENDFNQSAGYEILKQNNIDVLLLRLETSEIWSQAIAELLQLPNELTIVKTNIGSNKKYGELYQKMTREIKFPKSHLQEIYSCRYCRHFYPPNMIDRFINKWAW